MKKFNRKGREKKHSTFNPSPGLLKALKEIARNQGGTISYIFLEERIKFETRRNKVVPTTYKKKSVLSSNINSECFFKLVRGKLERKSPGEMVKMFESTKHDLGADYYIIN